MHIATQLIGREAVILAIVAAIGAWPAALLAGEVPRAARYALTPLLGLCGGSCVFATLIWFFPASATYPLVAVMALTSVAAALLVGARRQHGAFPATERSGDAPADSRLRIGIQLAVVALVAATPFTTAMIDNQSSGPTSYFVYDMADYTALQDGAQTATLRHAVVDAAANTNVVQGTYSVMATATQELEISPLMSNIDSLLGLHATDTISAALIDVIVIAALGLYASLSIALRRGSWWSVGAACLVAGGFLMQLFFDGSEGALCGLAVLVPVGAAGVVAARRPSLRAFFPLALIVAGLVDFYPTLMEVVVTVGVAALVAALWRARRRGVGAMTTLGRVAGHVLGLSLLVAAVDVVGFWRALRIWRHVIFDHIPGSFFPEYHLYASVIPGWIFQNTGFYSFSIGPLPHLNLWLTLIAPLAIVAVMIGVLRRHEFAGLAAVGILTSVAVASYQIAHNQCSYCEDRSLLAVSVLVMFLVGLTAARLGESRARATKALAAALVVVLGGTVGHSAYDEFNRYSSGSFFLQGSVKDLLARLPTAAATVDIEAFGTGADAPGELPAVYDAVAERTDGGVSLAADQSSNIGLAYIGLQPLQNSTFRPAYDYVLTRVPNIRTSRSVVAMEGGMALERRTSRLDVTLDTGLTGPRLPSDNPSGTAVVGGPLTFVVAGSARRDPSVHVTLDLVNAPVSATAARLAALGRLSGSVLQVCVPSARVAGLGDLRTASFSSDDIIGAHLVSMTVSRAACPGRAQVHA